MRSWQPLGHAFLFTWTLFMALHMFLQLAARGFFPSIPLSKRLAVNPAHGKGHPVFFWLTHDESWEAQLPFDVLLHKGTDDLRHPHEASSPAKASAISNNASLPASLQRLTDFKAAHPEVTVSNDPANVAQVTDRWALHQLTQQVTSSLTQQGWELHVPHAQLVQSEQDLTCVPAPCILKPVSACGGTSSHDLVLVLDSGAAVQPDAASRQLHVELGEAALQLPAIAQAFIDHGGLLHKVYCIGEEVHVSQSASIANAADHDESSGTRLPPMELLRATASALGKALGLSLFGFDVIAEQMTGRCFVIDLNYFPSFKCSEWAPQALHELLSEQQSHLTRIG
ncbi:hypothetical protein WJX73_008380 [Symbiochloris irregularis]|uniref:inositol-1,3,4-trisphosphate 5/6-kinase n=1 Tax=Symbiochloris irregularis TaxID=706552 RepID=A0AAW1PA10_9CHLO